MSIGVTWVTIFKEQARYTMIKLLSLWEGESEERASRIFKSYGIKTSLYYSIPCQLGLETLI